MCKIINAHTRTYCTYNVSMSHIFLGCGLFSPLQQRHQSSHPGLTSWQTTTSPRYRCSADLLSHPSNVMFIFCFMYYKPTTHYLLSPLTPLFSVGNSGSGPPVSEDSTVAAHTPRAAAARILQLHVRHTHATIRIICFTALSDLLPRLCTDST